MNKEKIQQKITAKKEELEVLETQLKQAEQKEASNNSEWLYIPELNIEVEVNVHDKGKSYDDLGLKDKEDQLLTIEQSTFLMNHPEYSKKLKMDGSSSQDDFYIKQFSDLARKNNYVAGFCSGGDWSGFNSCRDSWYAYSFRGVRFMRKKSKDGK